MRGGRCGFPAAAAPDQVSLLRPLRRRDQLSPWRGPGRLNRWCSQDDLPVRDRNQAELGAKVAAVLQVDQQLAARANIRAAVGKRVGHLVLVAEPVDEVPQLLQRHVMVAPVGPQQARLDEFGPRDITGPGGLDADDRAVAGRAAFQPLVQRRRDDPQQARGGRLGVHLAVEDGDAHAASVTCRRASSREPRPRSVRLLSGGPGQRGPRCGWCFLCGACGS